jgi:hypothetical protein
MVIICVLFVSGCDMVVGASLGSAQYMWKVSTMCSHRIIIDSFMLPFEFEFCSCYRGVLAV